ncbi:MAG: large-conductance mechanosensitive channel protein MscL [Candidatus Omnitrophica bacterium]|jgi:large conductance mechanosensitive channel|nr:large-conductance mechanosensitive channel protein MscL [Candidatus Omnitrophota bacterium]
MIKEFKEFAMKGNVVDMAIGIIIGAAFGSIVKSLVSDIVMPPISLLLKKVNFSNFFIVLKQGVIPGPYASLVQAQKAGAITINYGLFLNTIVSFFIIAFVVFFIVRAINRLKRADAAAAVSNTKECPFCMSTIPIKAIRCPYCTTELNPIEK